jgi:drug/metabolite transporter (DMT)-like permease
MARANDEAALAPVLASAGVGADRAGWVALLVGTAIISWSGILARFLDVGPLAGGAWRLGLAAPVLALWARLGARSRANGADFGRFALPLFFAGLAFAVDVGAFHIALTGTKVANASFIGNVAPVLAVAGGALFFGERPPARVWPALGFALLGSWVMAGMLPPSRIGFGDAFALAAAAAYATYLMLIKTVRAGLDGASATLGSAIVSAVALTAAAWLRGEKMIPTHASGWRVVALLGVVSHALGQGLTSVAIGRGSVGLVAVVILAQPPVSAALAWGVLGEAMSPLQMAGGAIILSAVFLARPR